MILVDTSVWVDHLRVGSNRLSFGCFAMTKSCATLLSSANWHAATSGVVRNFFVSCPHFRPLNLSRMRA